MSASLLYRIASVLFVLFAAGHTFGVLKFKAPTAEGEAVWDSMNDVQFHLGGRSYTYGGFYRGLGIYVTVYLLFSAFLSWQLGQMSMLYPQAAGAIGWAFCAVHVAGLALSVVYFAPITAVFSGVIAVCIGVAAWLT
ncbi:MAG TPA: hypothetical protein VGQ46_12235 [Thermoanaerobaculia bacterium]|jgi:hypothetical protein|nr:hypothetical protein [Thermoanaerobaculia bacterium]